ncbi:hypothetical protein EQ500_00540 [Lactobacillus sp. XV13L]|nr:hypothetical protein [Lactobacillus sp. XV13L]
MSKKKIELTAKIAKLAAKHLETTNASFDDLVNEALKCYLLDHLSSSQIKDALKEIDDASSQYTGKLFQSEIDNLNKY